MTAKNVSLQRSESPFSQGLIVLQAKLAAKDHYEFNYDWFASPIFLTGDYPASMKAYFKERLPPITPADSKLLLGSADFCTSKFGLPALPN